MPLAAAVTVLMIGFCKDELKPFGPVHAYTAPVTFAVLKFKFEPAHIGPLLLTVGVDGIRFTVTDALPAALEQLFTVTLNA